MKSIGLCDVVNLLIGGIFNQIVWIVENNKMEFITKNNKHIITITTKNLQTKQQTQQIQYSNRNLDLFPKLCNHKNGKLYFETISSPSHHEIVICNNFLKSIATSL